ATSRRAGSCWQHRRRPGTNRPQRVSGSLAPDRRASIASRRNERKVDRMRTDVRAAGRFAILLVAAWMLGIPAASAGPIESGDRAFEDGDYGEAMRFYMRAAGRGNSWG